METRVTNKFVKFIHDLSVSWGFRNLKLLHKIRRKLGDKNYVCDVHCDACKARKLRRQFSMTPEEGFDMLTVSHNYN